MKLKRGIGLWGMIMVLIFSGCHKDILYSDKVVVTVEDTKIYLDEIMYYILQVEANGAGLQEAFSNISDHSFWEEEYTNNMTYGDMLKEDALELAIMYELFYHRGLQKGYTLTQEDKLVCENNTADFLESMTEEQKVITELTKEKIYKIQEKQALGFQYYQELVEGLLVDEEEIRKKITYEEYKQYDIEYIFVPTVLYQEDGGEIPLSRAKKRQAYDRINTLWKQVKTGAAFRAIKKEEDVFETGETSFVKGDKTCEKKVEQGVLKLKLGEISDIILGESGYYIVRLVGDSSLDSYEKAMEKAVANERRRIFLKTYADIKKDYHIKVNTQVWSEIVMGNTTIKENKKKLEEK